MGCGKSIATQDQTQAKQAKCFAVSCMDFRLVDDTVYFFDNLGLNNNYDQFVLAGSSLGFTQNKYPQWSQTLIDHMSIGESLHHFREIIFVDHRDCGAYKKFYPEINSQNQYFYHQKHMQLTHDRLTTIFPNFNFRGFLMDITGNCVEIQIKKNGASSTQLKKRSPLSAMNIEITSMKSIKCNCN